MHIATIGEITVEMITACLLSCSLNMTTPLKSAAVLSISIAVNKIAVSCILLFSIISAERHVYRGCAVWAWMKTVFLITKTIMEHLFCYKDRHACCPATSFPYEMRSNLLRACAKLALCLFLCISMYENHSAFQKTDLNYIRRRFSEN